MIEYGLDILPKQLNSTRRGHLQFTRKMQTIVFSFSLIPAIVVMVISILAFSARFEPFARQMLAYDADLYANRIQTYLNYQFIELNRIRDNMDTRRQLSMDPTLGTNQTRAAYLASIRNHISAHLARHPETQALYVEDKHRNIIAYQDPLYPGRSSHSVPLTDSEGMERSRIVSPVITAPATSANDVYVFLGLPVVGDSGYQGSVFSVMELSYLRRLAQDDGMFRSTFRLVYDSHGSVVAMSGNGKSYWSVQDLDNRSNLSSKLATVDMQEHPVGTFTFSLDGERSIGQYIHIPELGWTVFTSISSKDIMSPILDTIPVFILFTILFMVALILALNHISTLFGTPIQALIDGMEHVRRHDYRYHIEIESKYEFNTIVQAFNSLMDHVAQDTEELRRLNTELDTLTANLPGGLFKCSLADGMPFLLVSEPFVTLAGYPDKRTLINESGNSFLHTIHPDDRNSVEMVIRTATSGTLLGTFEYRSTNTSAKQWISCSFRIPEVESRDIGLILFGMAVDTTAMHEAFEQLRTSDERYRIILEQTDEVIFEWSMVQKRFLFISREKNWIRMFGQPFPPQANLLTGDLYEMHPADRVRFEATLNELIELSLRSTRIEVRLTKVEAKGDKYIWTRFLLTSLFDNQGGVERVAGRIQDIHDEKVESLRLIGLSQTDSLTALMNRRGFQASVTRILEVADGNQNHHVLIMIDADDFKAINDTHGHLYGDTVLTKLALHLKTTFRATDLFGRLGGDEFAVFLVNFPDREILIRKITELLANLRQDNLSCSIGIAMYPEDGLSFTELYTSADRNLYTVKNQGKDGYAFSNSGRIG